MSKVRNFGSTKMSENFGHSLKMTENDRSITFSRHFDHVFDIEINMKINIKMSEFQIFGSTKMSENLAFIKNDRK